MSEATSISIIGSGVVGTSIGSGFERLGHKVVFYDVDRTRVEELKNGHDATASLDSALERTAISFICVPTPFIGRFDSSNIISATQEIAKALRNKENYHLIVIKSTVIPTTTETVVIPILEKYKKIGEEVGICVNPEFLTEIANTWTNDEDYERDFFNEDRIVIGEYDKKSGDILEGLYEPLKRPIFRVDLRTAEMIKYASNCMLATKISYWNQLFLISQELEIDSQKVADIVGLDPRIGRYGTIHGKAFGGSCLPKDLKAFIEFAEEFQDVRFLKAVDDINEKMKKMRGVRE